MLICKLVYPNILCLPHDFNFKYERLFSINKIIILFWYRVLAQTCDERAFL